VGGKINLRKRFLTSKSKMGKKEPPKGKKKNAKSRPRVLGGSKQTVVTGKLGYLFPPRGLARTRVEKERVNYGVLEAGESQGPVPGM